VLTRVSLVAQSDESPDQTLEAIVMSERCSFVFICDRKWDDLVATASPDVKFCGDCRQRVFHVTSELEEVVATTLGRCVAVRRPAPPDEDLFAMTVGGQGYSPSPAQFFGRQVHVRLAGPLAPERRESFQLDLPALFDGGDNEAALMAGREVSLGWLMEDEAYALAIAIQASAQELTIRLVAPTLGQVEQC